MTQTATLAGGCFWCTEAVMKRLKGIVKVTPGYSGGKMDNPDYDHVSMGNTGHAEAIQVEFNPSIISYDTILDVFFATHDPTTLNAQGNDIGTQYRSAIFYHDEDQRKIAESKMKPGYVTEIVPFEKFYSAEDYHKDYYDKNRESNPYCTVIIDPKVKKLLSKFSEKVKEEYK
jgi:peptide-methionine (S)-S-oxide reductase